MSRTDRHIHRKDKLGCLVWMVVAPILPHEESGPNDHRKDEPRFTNQELPSSKPKKRSSGLQLSEKLFWVYLLNMPISRNLPKIAYFDSAKFSCRC